MTKQAANVARGRLRYCGPDRVAALLDQLRGLIQSAKPGNEGPDEDDPSSHLPAV